MKPAANTVYRSDCTAAMRVGSLCSGIGGIELGLERAGMEIVWFSEVEPYCCEVLAKHWPGVPNHGDLTAADWTSVESVDLVSAGFPCQPASVAGRRKGMSDDRWLWDSIAACLRVVRPRYVLLENVPGLLTVDAGRAFGRVLGDLAALGYDAEWAVFPASAVGAPHRRERVWIVAYAGRAERGAHAIPRCESHGNDAGGAEETGGAGECGDAVAYPGRPGRWQDAGSAPSDEGTDEGRTANPDYQPSGRGESTLAHAVRQCLDGGGDAGKGRRGELADSGMADSASLRRREGWPEHAPRNWGSGTPRRLLQPVLHSDFWDDSVLVRGRPAKPELCLLAHGIPRRVAKLRALGNAVVPQCAEYVGHCIMEAQQGIFAVTECRATGEGA